MGLPAVLYRSRDPRRRVVQLLTLPLVGLALAGTEARAQQAPPPAARSSHVDTLHGVAVPDPYRALEQMQSASTLSWVRAQDAFARRLAAETPGRATLRERIARVAAVHARSAPVKEGGRYFYTTFPAIGPSGDVALHVRDSTGSRTAIAVGEFRAREQRAPRRAVPSADGTLVAYGLAARDSEWETVRIRDLTTGRDLADSIVGIFRYSALSWSRDGRRGFYYTRFERPSRDEALTATVQGGVIYYHQVGTSQDADERVFAYPQRPEWLVTPQVTDDGRYLIISARHGVDRRSTLFVRDLAAGDTSIRTLTGAGDALYQFVGNDGPAMWVHTNLHATRGRIVSIDVRHSARTDWRELVPEGADAIDAWVGASAIGGDLLVAYRRDALLAAKVFDRNGALRYELALPKVGSVWTGFVGRSTDPEAFYTLQGVVDPGTVYSLDIRSGISSPFLRPQLPYDPDEVETKQVFLRSRDGTRLPMFVAHRKGFVPSGEAPAWIYGYGSQSWTAAPWFQPLIAEWLREGGVWAVPNLRGGGEYGEEWRQAGIARNKQNGIDDFLAAAEWLVANRYAAPKRVVAHTSSAGGVLVAAAIVQRPELFAASVLEYSALDVLRYDQFSAGRRWTTEYGTVGNAADFKALMAYAPIQRLRRGVCYPTTIVTPGERDEVAAPMHSYKFVAALQHAQGCPNPVLLRVSWGAGHNAGATVADAVDNWTDQLAIVRRSLIADR